MKRISILILGFLLLIGCQSNKEKNQAGPLSQIQEFEVYAFFSPYEKFDQDLLFNTLVDCLKNIGQVKIIDSSSASTSARTPTQLFLSLGAYRQENKGSIEILSPVEIEANQFKTDCIIWRSDYDNETENLPYPVIEDGKVAFKRDKQASDISFDDPASVLRQMIEKFANEYRHFNSEKEKPTFRVYASSN